MNLNGGQNIVKPSGGGGGGGGMRRLLDIVLQGQSYSRMLEGNKELIKAKSDEKIRAETTIFDHKTDNSYKGQKAFSDWALEELPADHPDVVNKVSKPHPVTGKHYVNAVDADHYIKANALPGTGGAWHIGPGIGGITHTEAVTERNKNFPGGAKRTQGTPKERTGYSGNMADTKDALDKGLILPEQAAIISRGYKAKNPNLKESSWKNISRVNSNLDKLPKPEIK